LKGVYNFFEEGFAVTLIIEAVILGILTGAVYALMSSGLTLIFGVMDIVNIAQGILVVLGAYLSYFVEQRLHIDPFIGLLFILPGMFVLGMGIEWAFVRRIKQDRAMLSILVTYAVALVIEGLLNLSFTTDVVQLHAWYVDASFPVFGFYLPDIYVLSFLLSMVLLVALYLLVYRTKFGHSLQAAMQNSMAATLIGIDVEKVSAITFGIGVALAGASGLAFGATNAFNAASSYDLISRLLVIIVLGGMGSLKGAFIGSITMLIIGDLTAVVWSPVWSSTVFFALLVVLLLLRPQGLFGQLEGRKQ
jgi:branched-chain amino acid transport system permease protein